MDKSAPSKSPSKSLGSKEPRESSPPSDTLSIDEQETAGSGSGMMAINKEETEEEIKERDILEATHQGKGSTGEDF